MRSLFFAAIIAAAFPSARPRVAAAEPAPTSARLSGRVTDTTGTPLAQVRVTVIETHRSAITDLEGRYVVPDLPAGTYSMSFALVGYAPQVRRVTLRDTDVTLDLTLKPTAVELPELQVTASAAATT